MKEVMCIMQKAWWSGRTRTSGVRGPAYGEICTVIEERREDNYDGYIIEGYGDEPFIADAFIPLSKPAINIEEEQLEMA